MLTISMAASSSHFAPAPKRPKLSLQTNSLPVNYSCTSASLPTSATSTVAAATPTTLNTFNNTYDLAHRPTPPSHLAAFNASRLSRSQSPRPTRRHDRPYHLPYGVKSILKNSDSAGFATASPSTGTRKVFFPQAKKVGFKLHLEEEIVNEVYTARHSDLVWEDDDVDVMESVETQPEVQSSTHEATEESTSTVSANAMRTRRDSGVSFSFTEVKQVDAKPLPSTTLPGRRKRRWEWTLSPVRATFADDSIDTSGLDSEWVVVSIQRERSEEPHDASIRPAKRRAASVDADGRAPAQRRMIRGPIRANTL